jgi:peptide deformylase
VVTTFTIRMFGDPVLRQRARDVTELNGELARLANTMIETMHEANGVGLAAPQVGVQKRLFTYDVGEGPAVLVNPEIVDHRDEWTFEEGCLSLPGLQFDIVRPKVVTARGVDVDGHDVIIEGDELLGRLIQHEIDHLDGVLLLERLDPDRRKEALRDLRTRAFDGVAPVGSSHRL